MTDGDDDIVLWVLAILVGLAFALYIVFRKHSTSSGKGQGKGSAAGPENVNLADRTLYDFQAKDQSRLDVSDGVLTVRMRPGDTDTTGSKGGTAERNEVRFRRGAVLKEGESATLAFELKVNGKVPPWTVDGSSYYHLHQMKRTGDKRPVFAVSVKRGRLAMSGCSGTVTLDVPIAAERWIPVRASLTYRQGQVSVDEWSIDNKAGAAFVCAAPGNAELYFKAGQYRSLPNPIREETSVSFRTLSFVKR